MARKRNFVLLSAAVAAVAASVGVIQVALAHGLHHRFEDQRQQHAIRRHDRHGRTATPIKHVVVIFQENVSFDHYFGTYPNAANTDGQTFDARRHTPAVDGLLPATSPSLPPALAHTTNLLTTNPNESLPQRLDSTATGASAGPGGQLTCDQDHDYSDEQQAFDGGEMDHFVQSVGTGTGTSPFGTACDPKTVMDYYDGNTVTALWNYAQHFSMSDNSYGTTFGPSAPGAINLVSGDTGNVDTTHEVNSPIDLDLDLARRRPHSGRPERVLADQRRPAVLGRLLDARRRGSERPQHRRRAQRPRAVVGLVRRRFPPQRELPGGPAGDRQQPSEDQRVHAR